jgi:hypothetical protein
MPKTPEQWLEEAAPQKKQAIFKLFLGYAPGVGKTYNMLSEGIRRDVEGISDLDGEREQRVDVHRPVADQVLERGAVEKLHHDERLAFVLPDLVDGADIGMVQSGSSTGFPAESFEGLRILGYVLRQKLQSDKATQFGVFSLIDHTHPTTAQLLDDAVVRNRLADHLGKVCPVRDHI